MPQPGSQHGHIAVSADGANWIWTPQRSAVYVTHDRGNSWQEAKGIVDNLRVVEDKVNTMLFYALDLYEGKLYSSMDGGNSFTDEALPGVVMLARRGAGRGDNRGGQDRVYAEPGREGGIWIAAWDGLYRSMDGGKHFSKMKGVEELHAFGFGKGAPGSGSAAGGVGGEAGGGGDAGHPALYLVGVVKGVNGIFRSDDMGRSWVRINDDQHQWGLVLQIAGDPKKYGRVYVGTHGRGIFYGDPNGKMRGRGEGGGRPERRVWNCYGDEGLRY